MVSDSTQVMDTYENLTRDQMIAMMDSALEDISEESRATATFEIREYSKSYDPNSYCALFINFKRQETDKEEKDREKQEVESHALKQARELAEYERLKKKFG